ncbi:MAG: phage tail protein, partial [Terriglobales bacterium]
MSGGKHGGSLASQNTNLGAIRVQVSIQGSVRPLVFGTNRISAKLLDYDDFTATPVKNAGKKGGKGGGGKAGGNSGQTIYKYSASIMGGLCRGPIGGIGNVWDTQGNLLLEQVTYIGTVPVGGGDVIVTPPSSAYFFNDLGVTAGRAYSVAADDYGGPGPKTLTGTDQVPYDPVTGAPAADQYAVTPISGGAQVKYTFHASNAGEPIEIVYLTVPQTSSGNLSPGETLQVTVFQGSQPQSAWSHWTSAHPSKALSYAGWAYSAIPNADLGESGTIPNLTWEIFGLLIRGGGVQDAHAPSIATFLLTDPADGAQVDASLIDSLTQWSNYCIANGLFFSPVFDAQQPASDMLQMLCEMTNTAHVFSEGKFKFKPYGDTTVVGNGATFTPQTFPVYDLTDDDFQGAGDPLKVMRKSKADAYNSVSVEFVNRGNSYNPEIAEAKDQSQIEIYGLRKLDPKQYHGITNADVAKKVCDFQLKREVYIQATYEFKLGWQHALLECMDIVTLTDADLGMSKVPVRITKMDEDDTGLITVQAEEFPWGTATPTLYPHQAPGGVGPDGYADPGMVNAPVIFEANDRISRSGQREMWFAVSGANPNWGGCTVHVSADGSHYDVAGRIHGRATMGVLSGSLASHADPDTTDSVGVDLSESLGSLLSVSSDDCDNFRSLCYVNGELISYENATLGAVYQYTLGTKLRRGVFGSPIAAHIAGDAFVSLDYSIFVLIVDPQWNGKTMHFKFTSFNRYRQMEQDISLVTDYTYDFSAKFGNYNSFVSNDATVDNVPTPGGGPYTAAEIRAYGKVAGVGTPGTNITFNRDDGSTFTAPYLDTSGQALTTTFYAMFNPADDSTYWLSDYNTMTAAVKNGHICLGSTTTPNSAGSGGATGGGGGYGGGGCPWEEMLDNDVRLADRAVADTLECLCGPVSKRLPIRNVERKPSVRCLRAVTANGAEYIGSFDTRCQLPGGSCLQLEEMLGKPMLTDTGEGT